jgi:aspartate-semialdehyde dehydrogenase
VVIPEVNPGHIAVIDSFRKRLGVARGLIAVKSNCSLQSYVPAIHPRWIAASPGCSPAPTRRSPGGQNLRALAEMVDNVIPFIRGEGKSRKRSR